MGRNEAVEPPSADLANELDAKINSLCAVAQRSLEETWTEVGARTDERRSAIAHLKEELTNAFLTALTRETGEAGLPPPRPKEFLTRCAPDAHRHARFPPAPAPAQTHETTCGES
jgi:hypothetical protein